MYVTRARKGKVLRVRPAHAIDACVGLVHATGHLNQIFRDLASFMTFIRSPLIFKVEVIKPLIASFPHRKFVLVGDDGQQDPGTGRAFPAPHRKHDSRLTLKVCWAVRVLYAEVYAEIAQEFPDQVLHIFIHHVNGTNEVLLLFVSPSSSSS
jgi:hypothetical protein